MHIFRKNISVLYLRIVFITIFLFIFVCSVLSIFINRKADIQTPSNTLYLGGVYTKESGLNPYYITDGDNLEIVQFIYSSLIVLNEKGEVKPDLAEEWLVNPDFKSINFKLRKDARFHDDMPLTSKDIKWTWEKMIHSLDSAYSQCYSFIDSVETPDAYTVSFHFNRVTPSPEYYFNFDILPCHLKADYSASGFNNTPIGSGPFSYDRWDSKGHLRLKRNPLYYRRASSFKFIEFVPFNNIDAVWSGFIRDEIDFYQRLTHDQYNMISQANEFNIRTTKSLRYIILLLNRNHEFLKNKMIRQAIDLCIDRDELVEKVFYGKARVISCPFDADSAYYDNKVKDPVYNPDEAVRILKACGFEDSNHDGILEKQKTPFVLRLTVTENMPENFMIAKAIKLQLKQIGILVEIINLSSAEDYAATLSKEMDFDMVLDYKPLNLNELAFIYWVKDIGRKPYLLEKADLFTALYWKMLKTINKAKKRYYCEILLKMIAHEKTSLFLVNPLEMIAFHKTLDISGTSFAPQFQYRQLGDIKKEVQR
jgi:peptide/nickel transport system substrate-binding protein